MKVNMTPNPLDVVTIHASQGDTEARQWEFELHNNGELIDTSDVKEQMVFKAYKGGTEQLLPENGSVPTTSPFKGDIRYPQGLLSDQEFTYRQSPTEEDGLAKITDIKGNTLVWNQLVQNGNFADGTNNWEAGGSSTISASNGELTVTVGGAWNNDARQNRSLVVGHKYLGTFKVKSNTLTNIGVALGQFGAETNVRFASTETLSSAYQTIVGIATITESTSVIRCSLTANASSYTGQTFTIKDVMLFDLTQMGLDTLTDAEVLKWFADYFPLSYYSYNQGSLLSFNGNGIKTVGFNQWDEEWEIGNWRSSDGQSGSLTDRIRSKNYIEVFPNTDYYFKSPVGIFTTICWYDESHTFISSAGGTSTSVNTVFRSPVNAKYMRFNMNEVYGTVYNNNICINISSSRNGEYEPYTSHTTNLPIATYFPTGMKSAGSVYDELTPRKAITRIGAVDLGSLTWDYISEIPIFQATITGGRFTRGQDLPCDMYSNSGYMSSANMPNMTYQILDNGKLWIKNTSYTSATAFKQAMADKNVKLYYELATPTETSFTTASLVTENAEIPLSNDDGVLIGKCTEQLSENPGFIDAKIKLSDADGECYSNKIQLHVERSPQ